MVKKCSKCGYVRKSGEMAPEYVYLNFKTVFTTGTEQDFFIFPHMREKKIIRDLCDSVVNQ